MCKDQISLSTLLLIVAIYVLSNLVYDFLLRPLEGSSFHASVVLGQLFYLPHGVAIITTWLHRKQAIIYLALAGVVHEYAILQLTPDVFNLLAIASIALFPYLVMELFRACGLNVYQMPGIKENHMWRTIILVTFVSSVATSLFNGFISSLSGVTETAFNLVMQGLIGGVSGTFMCLLLIYLAFKLLAIYSSFASK